MCLQHLRSLLVVPGAQTSENESRPTFATDRTQNHSASSAQWYTFEEVVDTEDEDNDGSDTIDPGEEQEYVRDELEVLATCMDNGENDVPIPGVDNSQLETACLKLAELPEALATVQAARRGASDSNRHSPASPGQRVPNSARDQRQSDDRLARVFGRTRRPRSQPQQRRGTKLQAKLDKRKARSVCHACGQTGHWAGDPQCPGRRVNVIELEDEVTEFEPNQDAGTRQILSVQVDVSDVRFLHASCACREFHGRWTKRGSPRCHRRCSPIHSCWTPGIVRIVKSVLKEVLDTSSM